jgi:hypothetical protein
MKKLINFMVVVLSIVTVNLFPMDWDREGAISAEGVISQEHQEEIERKKAARELRERQERDRRMQARQRALVHPQAEADQEQRQIRMERIRQGLSGL